MKTAVANVYLRFRALENQFHRGCTVDCEGDRFGDLNARGRRFLFSHCQPMVSNDGIRETWLVYDDVARLSSIHS
jgi:hypothetical protein